MSQLESEHYKIDQLKIRVQNLKVLLEDAVLKGYHDRMRQLLADINEAEAAVAQQAAAESDEIPGTTP